MAHEKIIGIDLGTTYSCVAVMEGGKPCIISNAEGLRTTPSVVAFTHAGERIVGQLAKRQAITNSSRTIRSIKRKMGTDYRFTVDDTSYSAEQISAVILEKLKNDAQQYIGEKISKAVITVPAYFNDLQRQATCDAGRIAGIEVLRIINEPTASALAYGLDKLGTDSTILVYDLGGGTFDVSILRISDGVFEVQATSGNNHLGGDDFDQVIIDWMKSEFNKENNIDLSGDPVSMQRLKEAAEVTKIELSTMTLSQIHLPFLTASNSEPKHLQLTLTRSQFDELTAHLVKETMEPVKQALHDAGLEPNQIEKVLLVGGSTRIPAVQEAIKIFFQKESVKSINPDEAVALGAAIQASVLTGETQDILLLDVTPLSLGIETVGGLFTKIIERNTTIPTSRSMIFTTTEDGQTSVKVHCLQGERELAEFNQSLAQFTLDGLPRAPKGVPTIEVIFSIDADGIVQVKARDVVRKTEQSIIINRSSGLSRVEVEKLAQEAQEHVQQDKIQKELIVSKIKAESLIGEGETILSTYKEVLAQQYMDLLQESLDNIKKVMQANDVSATELNSSVDKLNSTLLEIGKVIYTNKRKVVSEGEVSNSP